MGQYYLCSNIDKKEWLRGDFRKLTETSWAGNEFPATVEYLMLPGNPWHKTRIVWAGDYIDKGIFLPEDVNKEDCDLYSYSLDNFQKIESDIHTAAKLYSSYFKVAALKLDLGECFTFAPYIVNHTLKEYVDKRECPDRDGWIMHPLPLLTAPSNGEGGGDYYSPNGEEYIGRWAGNVISVEIDCPQGYKKITPGFLE